MSRTFSLLEQVGGLSWLELCRRSRALLEPKAAKLSASEQRTALAEYYAAHPRLCRRCEAPKMVESEYEEILGILKSLPWDKILRRNVPKSRKGAKATRESFVMGGVLGQPGFHGLTALSPTSLRGTARTS